MGPAISGSTRVDGQNGRCGLPFRSGCMRRSRHAVDEARARAVAWLTAWDSLDVLLYREKPTNQLAFFCLPAGAASHSFSFDHRRRPETLRTAIATAFFWPTSTTSRFPRVTPV